jgi:iron-sulfur cluster assembly protein
MASVKLTAKAVEAVKKIKTTQKREEEGLRIAVTGGGCSGFQYQLNFEPAPNPEDQVIEQDGLTIFFDPRSAIYLNGIELDYVDDVAVGSGFKFNNPNATGTCGCGESFTV